MRCFACTRSRSSTSRRVARPMPGRAQKGVPKGMPRSRWIRSACGLNDQVVEYFKPVQRPKWMSEDEYRVLPESIMRARAAVSDHGAGVPDEREVALVTTLLDAVAYPADALAELYGMRWRVGGKL